MKNEIERKESCRISLHGNAEFVAEDVTLKSDLAFEVEDGFRLYVYEELGQIKSRKEKIEKPTWYWNYEATEDFHLILKAHTKS